MNCRICDSKRIDMALDLGYQPWCNNFLRSEEIGKEPTYPLHLVYCRDCSTAQLDYTVPKEVMFGNHTYLSGITGSLSDHFRTIVTEVDSRFFQNTPGKSALDIGSNDGTQLKHFRNAGYRVLGIEPSVTTAGIAAENGIETINKFFNLELARQIQQKFHVVNAAGVFFHLEELHSVTDGIREILHDDGVFVVQFLYMKRIVENCAFDQIYHEHLLYYNLATLERLLNQHGLALFDAYLAPIHGGSIVGFITHAGKLPPTARLDRLRSSEIRDRANEYSTYRDFASRIDQMKSANLAYLDNAKQHGKRVFGLGAPVKGNTLLNYFGIGAQYLDCLVEKNELRRGLYSPGMHLPIVIEKELPEPPDIYYVLAWNFRDEILARNQALIQRGVDFYFPISPKGITE